MDGGATGMDEDTYQHLPILVAGGNTLLSIPMEQQVVHREASHLLSPHMTKKGIERHMISALQNAALSEVTDVSSSSAEWGCQPPPQAHYNWCCCLPLPPLP